MKVVYSNAMIELVYEIRRRIESDLKPSIKLANPDLLMELVHYFPKCKSAVSKALIKELMELAGSDWKSRLYLPEEHEPISHIAKMYRGVTSVESMPTKPTPAKVASPSTPKMIYRGRVVQY